MRKRHFTYQSLGDLRRDAERLGIDLPLVEDREEIRLSLIHISEPTRPY